MTNDGTGKLTLCHIKVASCRVLAAMLDHSARPTREQLISWLSSQCGQLTVFPSRLVVIDLDSDHE
jgi:hypothetical protein